MDRTHSADARVFGDFLTCLLQVVTVEPTIFRGQAGPWFSERTLLTDLGQFRQSLDESSYLAMIRISENQGHLQADQ